MSFSATVVFCCFALITTSLAANPSVFPVKIQGNSNDEITDIGTGTVTIDDTDDTITINIKPEIGIPFESVILTVEGEEKKPFKKPTAKPKTITGFRLVSRYNARALQLNNNGNSVQVWDVNPNDPNQLWYLDDNNVLRSSVNDYCIHSDGPYPATTRMTPCTTPSRESWTLNNFRITSQLDATRCMEVRDVVFAAGAQIADAECWERTHRMWDVVY